jgi:alkyl sulfatase BDS1-like metallo-beta-lactamase superfamily hydrolase
MLTALTSEALCYFVAVRLNGAKVADLHWKINWHLTDSDECRVVNLQNCTLTHSSGQGAAVVVASVRASREMIVALNVRRTNFSEAVVAGNRAIDGEQGVVEKLFAMLDHFTTMFDVVAPSLGQEKEGAES